MWIFDDELEKCIETIEEIRLKVSMGIFVHAERFHIHGNIIAMAGNHGFEFICFTKTSSWIKWKDYDKFLLQRQVS